LRITLRFVFFTQENFAGHRQRGMINVGKTKREKVQAFRLSESFFFLERLTGCGLQFEQCFNAEFMHLIVICGSSAATHLSRAQSKFHRIAREIRNVFA